MLLPARGVVPDADLCAAVEEAYAARVKGGNIGVQAEELTADAEHGDRPDVKLVPCTVDSIRAAGMGDRVCLDFTQLLTDDEGVLVGSSAKGLALIHGISSERIGDSPIYESYIGSLSIHFAAPGETFASGFVPARPFRVNAGPVHHYVRMGDGGFKYLAEITAGEITRRAAIVILSNMLIMVGSTSDAYLSRRRHSCVQRENSNAFETTCGTVQWMLSLN